MTTFSFRSATGARYVEKSTLAEVISEIRAYVPCTTKFRAVARFGENVHDVISFSPHVIGPNYVGSIGQE